MVVFGLIAAGLIGFALYRFGEVRGAWTRWRSSVGILRSRRGEALRLSGGLLVLLAIGGALALIVAYGLSGHH